MLNFRKRKEIIINPPETTESKPEPKEIVVRIEPLLADKIKILDDYYQWLFDNEFDARDAAVYIAYKQKLFKEEKLKGNEKI